MRTFASLTPQKQSQTMPPTPKQLLFAKQPLYNQPSSHFQEQDSNTFCKAAIGKKLKYKDEEATRPMPFSQKRSSLIDAVPSKLKEEMVGEMKSVKIQKNEKVDEIMKSIPLREKYFDLLPKQQKLPIGWDHQHLLKKMQCIDRTIEFLLTNREKKFIFFEELRRNIEESIAVTVKLSHFQQLLFLDELYYNYKWELNEKKQKYQILVSCRKNQQADARKSFMRAAIVTYLTIKQKQFLQLKNITKTDPNKWHPDFKYQSVIIPQKSLPPNPDNLGAEIRSYSDLSIHQLKNPDIKQLFIKHKQQSEVKSLSSNDVAKMLFSKVPSKQIEHLILQSVKNKQKLLQMKKTQQQTTPNVDKELILKIFQQIQIIFLSKSVNNIFKSTIIDLLQKKLRFVDRTIYECFQLIMQNKQIKQIGAFKEILTSQKLKVIQANKSKFKQVRDFITKQL